VGRWGGFGGRVKGLEGARENGLDDSGAWLRCTLAPCLGVRWGEAVTAFALIRRARQDPPTNLPTDH
jgi:hypothetical protein